MAAADDRKATMDIDQIFAEAGSDHEGADAKKSNAQDRRDMHRLGKVQELRVCPRPSSYTRSRIEPPPP